MKSSQHVPMPGSWSWPILGILLSVAIPLTTLAAAKSSTTEQDFALTRNRRQRRSLIVGGTEVDESWSSSSHDSDDDRYSAFAWTGITSGGWGCGGALIHSDIVLTAAHCQWALFETMQMYIGPYYIDNHDHWGETLKIKSLVPHPGHNGNLNNVLLVQLYNTSAVKPYRYNTDPTIPKVMDDPLTIFGFGTTREGGNLSSVLRVVDVYAYDNDSCVRTYPAELDRIHLCAGTVEGGRDACDSDSGSPLLVGNTVVGVTDDGIGCGLPNIPSLNARVSGFADWIERSICELSQHPPKSCKNLQSTKNGHDMAVGGYNTSIVVPTNPANDGAATTRFHPAGIVILSFAFMCAMITGWQCYASRRKSVNYQEIPSITISF